ncbi:MAG: dephospho-CoA kinase [Pseudomonadota bacterium]
MIVAGLTGSIGMGKSTVAQMFGDAGAHVWDADAAVHRLYAAGGEGVPVIRALVPDAIEDGAVSRPRLRTAIMEDPALLKKIEAGIHPLVGKDRIGFLQRVRLGGARLAVLDIPLLLEGGRADMFDYIIVVSAPAEVQRDRVLARPGMTEEAFEAILAKQMPDAEKRAYADYVVDTGSTLEETRAQVQTIMAQLSGDPHYA